MKHILENGIEKMDRTGIGTKSIFGYQMRFDLSEGFPLVTTKKVHFKSIAHELLWFIRGDTNIRYLVNNGVGIWNDWPYQNWLRETNQQDDYKNITAVTPKRPPWNDIPPSQILRSKVGSAIQRSAL